MNLFRKEQPAKTMEEVFFTVDFKDVHTYFDVHERLFEGLELPDYYGANLDALWDCLTDNIMYIVHIDLINYNDFEKMHKVYAGKVLQVFRDFKHCYNNEFCSNITIRVFRGNTAEELT